MRSNGLRFNFWDFGLEGSQNDYDVLKPRVGGAVNFASFEKRVDGNARPTPSSPSNPWWNGRRGAGPCQALAAEGGGRKVRLYKGQASPATITTGGPMGRGSRPRTRAERLGGRHVTHSKFKRASIFV